MLILNQVPILGQNTEPNSSPTDLLVQQVAISFFTIVEFLCLSLSAVLGGNIGNKLKQSGQRKN